MPYPTAFSIIPPGLPDTSMRDGLHLMAHNNIAAAIPSIQQVMGLNPSMTLTDLATFARQIDDLTVGAAFLAWQWDQIAAGVADLTRRFDALELRVRPAWFARFGRRYNLVFDRAYSSIPGGELP